MLYSLGYGDKANKTPPVYKADKKVLLRTLTWTCWKQNPFRVHNLLAVPWVRSLRGTGGQEPLRGDRGCAPGGTKHTGAVAGRKEAWIFVYSSLMQTLAKLCLPQAKARQRRAEFHPDVLLAAFYVGADA